MSLILFLRNSVRKESYLKLVQPRDGTGTEDHLHYPEYSIIAEFGGACSDPRPSLGILFSFREKATFFNWLRERFSYRSKLTLLQTD